MREAIACVRAQPEQSAEALSALTALAKKQGPRAEIDKAFFDRAPLIACLSAENAKVRKNAARLLGALGNPSDGKALAAALECEQTLFVVPSILLALGSCGGEEAKAALAAYAPPSPRDETEQKHVAEIRAAARRAKAVLFPSPLRTVDKLDKKRTALLVPPPGFLPELMEELSELGFESSARPEGAAVATEALSPLFAARCFTELLLPVAENLPLRPEALAEAVRGELTQPYRVELSGYSGDRHRFIHAFVEEAGGDNNPSAYALEARIVVHGERADLYIKPASFPDTRFAYRKKTLPASMHPALAACIVRCAAPFCQKAKPAVLDPFCGSGTLLFEREKRGACSELLGADIAAAAVSAARENARAGGSRAKFIQKDARAFVPRVPADEVYANLPFGNRVGVHKDNEDLYRVFVNRLPSLLAGGGVAALYTMEYTLLSRCLERSALLVPLEKRRTEAGGLLPWVFLLKRK